MSAIVIDTETTGVKSPEPIQVAWRVFEAPGDVTSGWDGDYKVTLLKPSKPIELGALATHHILDEELEGRPPSAGFRILNEAPGTDYIIGHNIDFDWRVLGEPRVRRICTLALSRMLWPEADSHGLGAMMYHLDREHAKWRLHGAHDAVCDVRNTLILLERVLAKLTAVVVWHDLWVVSEKARLPSKMPNGKHKGVPIRDVPADYLRWLLRQPDVDPYLKKAINQNKGWV